MVSHTEPGEKPTSDGRTRRQRTELDWIRDEYTFGSPEARRASVQKRAKEIWYIRRRWCHIDQRDPKVTQAKQSHVTRRVDIIVGRAKHITPSRALGPEATFQANARIQPREPKRISDGRRGGGSGKATNLNGD